MLRATLPITGGMICIFEIPDPNMSVHFVSYRALRRRSSHVIILLFILFYYGVVLTVHTTTTTTTTTTKL